ncbi:MAG: M23 family metallopeptidase [Verrucomicrobia bacterium]|nr:MAG: M23 family metallopeptidase [Verrucomicrobiota bacterium]
MRRGVFPALAGQSGRDAFHRVPISTKKIWDAVERVPTNIEGAAHLSRRRSDSRRFRFAAAFILGLAAVAPLRAETFHLPTANHAIFEKDGLDRFLVGTIGKPPASGGFGCVRTDGWQMHEGLDIRCLQRDKRGEPTDPVLATADGTVAYVNAKAGLSNYGRYIILRHTIDGIEIYSLYGHLSEIRDGVRIGAPVKAGEPIAIMGHTANTREGISKDRAHVHFELNLLVNDRFESWHKQNAPGQRNDHGMWNGQNLLGLDPMRVLQEQKTAGASFNLLGHIRTQTELCRVLVRATDFPWVHRYAALVRANPLAQKERVAGYELALNFNGIPFELTPRAASEIKSKTKIQLLSVNEAEYQRNPCRKLVHQRGSRWELTTRGTELMELLIH